MESLQGECQLVVFLMLQLFDVNEIHLLRDKQFDILVEGDL